MHIYRQNAFSKAVVPNLGAPKFTAGVREQIYFEVGLGDKTITLIIVI